MSEYNFKNVFPVNLHLRLIFKMENQKFHFCLVMLPEFKKGVIFRCAIKSISDFYLDPAPVVGTISDLVDSEMMVLI